MTIARLETRRELELMQHLQHLANQRANQERILAAAHETLLGDAQREFEQTGRKLNEEYSQRLRNLQSEFTAARAAADERLNQGRREAQDRFDRRRRQTESARIEAKAAIEHDAQEQEWQALAVFDASKHQPSQVLEDVTKRIAARRLQVDGLERDAHTLLSMRGLAKAIEPSPEQAALPDRALDVPGASADDRLQAALAELRESVIQLQDQRVASLFLEGGRWLGWIFVIVTIFTVLGGLAADLAPWGWSTGSAVGLVVGLAVVGYFVPRGRRWTLDGYRTIESQIAHARRWETLALVEAKAASQRLTEEINRRRDQDIASTRSSSRQKLADLEQRYAADLAKAEAELGVELDVLTTAHERAVAEAENKFPPLLQQTAAEQAQAERDNAERFDERRTRANVENVAAWQELRGEWLSGFNAVADELAAMQRRCRELFPDWDGDAWHERTAPTSPPEAIRFGQCPLPLQLVKNALPEDKRMDPGVRRLLLPAVMSLSEHPRLAITVDPAGRQAAVETLQLVMLRLLLAMPPGKVRFTIIDGDGMGENFAGFMHLADVDEQMVGGRIWTDPKQIDDRLALIAAHMEKVFQKYLRNEFATIAEYNETAGEVAEPYHVVVVANFPAAFTESSARRLASIMASGPRCGVYTVVSIDRSLRLPHEFKISSLLEGAVHLEWVDGRLIWRYPLFEKLPLEIDPLPDAQRLIEILQRAGEASRAASKVEVPFSLVAPHEGEFWSQDSGRELVVPIGRAGAKELQVLRLGIGTAQHVLIAGKTGSGKSTLLHALVTNLALHYGPDQVEFYLVDFKKGVEFKAYATGKLPHARVIAIESEREFGVSVLERLDDELRRRGELFREYGVQDLAGFRSAAPNIVMPRTLLIIDEFQELFVADDKLAQDAALLLDRLVRQGRAFGVHVLLGSQTLAGAYSLARSTLGQMAVRIALECSEADAHLILSDENAAARLLSRPGEAIYNDQNGLVAGNHPFQVVWLPDAKRQEYLAKLRVGEVGEKTGAPGPAPAIVFEGNLPADPRDNPELTAAIAKPERLTHQEPTIWLGSAVRIEPATRLMLRRQGGHNLAVVGQQESLALGILGSAVIALAAQHGEAGARFIVLDGTRPESSERGAWASIAEAVGPRAEVISARDAAPAVQSLAEEVERRAQSPEERFGAIYLVVHDLAQFRELRLTEDDFGFGLSNGKPPSVDKRFREILKEGPAVGVHVLLWCESYNSLMRSLDRLSLREVDFRVAMQMSGADSTSLIDSPAAALLGEHRALLYRDDLGTQTKFRPYNRPSAEWLSWCAAQIRGEAADALPLGGERVD